jgi:hypothetical protein
MELPYDPAALCLRIHMRNTGDLNRYLCTNVHSSIIYNSHKVKQSKCPPTDEWRNKMWQLCVTDYYSALKSKILTHATP